MKTCDGCRLTISDCGELGKLNHRQLTGCVTEYSMESAGGAESTGW